MPFVPALLSISGGHPTVGSHAPQPSVLRPSFGQHFPDAHLNPSGIPPVRGSLSGRDIRLPAARAPFQVRLATPCPRPMDAHTTHRPGPDAAAHGVRVRGGENGFGERDGRGMTGADDLFALFSLSASYPASDSTSDSLFLSNCSHSAFLSHLRLSPALPLFPHPPYSLTPAPHSLRISTPGSSPRASSSDSIGSVLPYRLLLLMSSLSLSPPSVYPLLATSPFTYSSYPSTLCHPLPHSFHDAAFLSPPPLSPSHSHPPHSVSQPILPPISTHRFLPVPAFLSLSLAYLSADFPLLPSTSFPLYLSLSCSPHPPRTPSSHSTFLFPSPLLSLPSPYRHRSPPHRYPVSPPAHFLFHFSPSFPSRSPPPASISRPSSLSFRAPSPPISSTCNPVVHIVSFPLPVPATTLAPLPSSSPPLSLRTVSLPSPYPCRSPPRRSPAPPPAHSLPDFSSSSPSRSFLSTCFHLMTLFHLLPHTFFADSSLSPLLTSLLSFLRFPLPHTLLASPTSLLTLPSRLRLLPSSHSFYPDPALIAFLTLTSTTDDLIASMASLLTDGARIDGLPPTSYSNVAYPSLVWHMSKNQHMQGYIPSVWGSTLPPAAPAFEAFTLPGGGSKNCAGVGAVAAARLCSLRQRAAAASAMPGITAGGAHAGDGAAILAVPSRKICYVIKTLLSPQQHAMSNTCTMDEEEGGHLADDTVSAAAVKHFWSPHVQVQESDSTTMKDLSRVGFGKVLQDLREQLTDRKLTKETFVVATPADPANGNGGLAATHVLTAMQEGKPITVTVAEVLWIQWVETNGAASKIN
ncbi:hypothetical protein B0H10DRAFT_2214544 [Mycena sp. CBHHK59/15]|nr:hypothetical protein B0H10DRAFT_2214544 [Mycena sp. CBHHK59/15]